MAFRKRIKVTVSGPGEGGAGRALKDIVAAYATEAYGDLEEPNYEFYAKALERNPYRRLVGILKPRFKVRSWNGPDDVSMSYTLERRNAWRHRAKSAPVWSLWLSVVGPFALLCLTDTHVSTISRQDVVVSADSVSAEFRADAEFLLSALRAEGLIVMSAADVESTFDGFSHPDGRFPVTLFVILFGDDDVPWWYAY